MTHTRSGGIPDETRYSAEGWELRLGAVVYSRRLHWAETRGGAVRARWGHYSGTEGRAYRLLLRHAAKEWRCHDLYGETGCGARIEPGDMHGSDYGIHLCLECVQPHEPEVEFHADAAAAKAKP